MSGGPGSAPPLRDRIERPLPKRFYRTVGITPELGLVLDNRPVRTPMKQLLILPSLKLADAVAGEWSAQTDVVDPGTMPLTKLANTAIDRVLSQQDRIIDEIVAYAGSDLVCYRADQPGELVARQAAVWDPVLIWAQDHLSANFKKFVGVIHQAQPQSAIDSFRRRVASFDHWKLTGLHNITTMTGSAILATMLTDWHITPDAVWAAAHVDEDWQIAHWGEDYEARIRREKRRAEFDKTVEFMSLLAPS